LTSIKESPMYDTNTGRWTSEDPKGFGAGDANLFRYVKNAYRLPFEERVAGHPKDM
jgi:hypothetical protein